MTVDKHELLFCILIGGLFSLWANCVHDLVVKTQALREFFILDYVPVTWKCIPIIFSFISNSSIHVEWFLCSPELCPSLHPVYCLANNFKNHCWDLNELGLLINGNERKGSAQEP